MTRMTLVTMMLALTAAPAGAQTHGPAPTPGPQAFVGSWVGSFKTEMGIGGAKLVVTRPKEWKVSFEIEVDHPVEMGEVTDFKVEGKVASWSQTLFASNCKAEVELSGNTIKGELNCGAHVLELSLQKS